MKNNNVLNDTALHIRGINSIPSFLSIKLSQFEKIFLTSPLSPLLKSDFNKDDFINFYSVLHSELHSIMLDVYFRRWHWYTIYNHSKFGKVLCEDGVIRLIPYLQLPSCK